MATKMVGTRNRTKLRGELEMMEKFMKEKKSEVERVSMETPGEETEEKEGNTAYTFLP